jgi:hypothetical protein
MRVPVGFRNPVSQVHPVLSYIPEEAIATSGAWREKDIFWRFCAVTAL